MSKLDVPYFKQDTSYTCGPTALQMVLAYYGTRESEFDLAKELDTTKERGTWRVRMYEIATERGFHCYVNDGADFAEIEFLINLGIPPIVRFLEPESDEDHYGVVVAADENSLTIHDPWHGPHRTFSKEAFVPRWTCDVIGNCDQWLMAVSPEPIPLGHQFHPHE